MTATALAWIAAVTTATAIIMFWLMRAAQRDVAVLRTQARIANDTAESAVLTAKRMQSALKVVSDEIRAARSEREAADEVIKRAEEVIEGAKGPEDLQKAWNRLLKNGPRK